MHRTSSARGSGRRRLGRAGAAGTLAVLLVVVAVWIPKVLRLRSSVAEYAAWWSEPVGEAGGLVYAALGDSAAQGIGASAPEKGYVGLVADALRAETGQPVLVVNLSRSGARVRDVVDEQLPRLAALDADVVTVGIGGNDLRRYEVGAFRRDVAALMAELPANAVVADVPYFMHGRFEADAQDAAEVLGRLAEDRGLRVARLHEAMRERGWWAMFTDYAADWFHPNDRGHRVWASAFVEALGADLDRRRS